MLPLWKIFCCGALLLLLVPQPSLSVSLPEVPTSTEKDAVPTLKEAELAVVLEDEKLGSDAGSGVEMELERERREASTPYPDADDGDDDETVGDTLMDVYNTIPEEMAGMLVEMDIVNDELVQRVREKGVLPGEDLNSHYPKREKRLAYTEDTRKWLNHTVYYAFHSGIFPQDRSAVQRAISEWSRFTCLKFVERTNQTDYIMFKRLSGCHSHVGRVGGEQELSIGTADQKKCREHATILHELGHAIGFWHEQSRSDRDDYVRVLTQNVLPGKLSEFSKWYTTQESLNMSYDYHSIMHYSKREFAYPGTNTLASRDPAVRKFGRRDRLSPLDIKHANLLYGCPYLIDRTNVNQTIHCLAPNSFLIRNEMTNTCLSHEPNRYLTTPFTLFNHTVLYRVIAEPCNKSSPRQRWQWSNSSSLVNSATFLCLAVYREYNQNSFVLRTCKESDENQKWRCSMQGNFIMKPNTEECITVVANHATAFRMKRSFSEDGVQRRKSLVRNQLTGDVLNGRHSVEELTRELEDVLGQLREEVAQDVDMESMRANRIVKNAQMATSVTTNDVKCKFCGDTTPYQKWRIMDFNCGGTIDSGDNSICSEPATSTHQQSLCYALDMHDVSTLKSDLSRWLECKAAGYFIKGFYHTYNVNNQNRRDSGLISGVQCCAGDYVFTGETNTPVVNHQLDECYQAKWWSNHDYLLTRGWFTCPPGMFLKGIQLSTRSYFRQENVIKRGKCCKSKDANVAYMRCYTTNVTSVSDTGVHACHLEGFLVTEIVRFNCDYEERMCREEIKCCLPA